jgi:hypothetical protein
MSNVDLENAIIAAALIQSGEFKLSAFDDRGRPIRGKLPDQPGPTERLTRQAEVLSDPDFDWSTAPALMTLRKLTNAIRRALYEPTVTVERAVPPPASPVAPTD